MNTKRQIVITHLEEIKRMIADNAPLYKISETLHMKQSTLVKHLDSLGITYKGRQNWLNGKQNLVSKKPLSHYIDNPNLAISPSRLRKILIREGVKEEKCERCGLTKWRGLPIPLELHHSDKNRYNNKLDNLMILCSNCHAQMHGYSNFSTSKIAPRSRKAQNGFDYSFDAISVMKDVFESGSFLQAAKKYGVTANALIKKLKKRGFPYHTKDIKDYVQKNLM